MVEKLGESPFVYEYICLERFIHYFHQIDYIYHRARPTKILEIGPGDHTVTDILRRRGIKVKTLDAMPELKPDYIGDIRKPLPIDEKFDMVLCSEVFEHINIKFLPDALENIRAVIKPGGRMLVSLPYATVRLFPPRRDFGWPVSCEGRLITRIPMSWVQPTYSFFRGLYRFLIKRYTLKGSFRPWRIPEIPDDRIDLHHWETGRSPTTRRVIRRIMAEHFTIEKEQIFPRTNNIFFLLRNEEK